MSWHFPNPHIRTYLGNDLKDLKEFINSANPERLGNNPVKLDANMMLDLFSDNK